MVGETQAVKPALSKGDSEGGLGAVGRELEGRLGAGGRVGWLARDGGLERHRKGDVPRVFGRRLVDQIVVEAATLNPCVPVARPEYVTGDVQLFGDSPSREQWNVAPATAAEKLKVASALAEGFGGPATIDVSIAPGAGAATSQRYSAGAPGPTLSTTARTANECDPSSRP